MKALLFACLLGAFMGLWADDFAREVESQTLTLQKDYTISESPIYSTHLFPGISKRFKIATLPPDKFSIELSSADLKLLFARYGYTLHSNSEYVTLHYVNDMREREGVEFLERQYIKYYGDMLEIEKILVRPLGTRPESYELEGYELPQAALKKNSGTLMMKYHSPGKTQIKHLTLAYEVQGSLNVLTSTRAIGVNENLSPANTHAQKIKFERVGAPYIDKGALDTSSAKSYIRANMAITKDKIKSRVLVRKGDFVRVLSIDSGVSAEIVLIARQNGAKNDIINAQNQESGKILKIRILDTGKGEVI